jgi:hypothetical protein
MILTSALVLAGCNGERPQTGDTAVPAEGDAGMDSMPGMSDMERMQDGMMGEMMAHMQMMTGAGADSMQAMLPMHRQIVANMLSQMNREMREMSMTTDAQWDATVDSLRNDLTRMPEMDGQELQELMPAHHDRMKRLIEMHRTMMSDMEM